MCVAMNLIVKRSISVRKQNSASAVIESLRLSSLSFLGIHRLHAVHKTDVKTLSEWKKKIESEMESQKIAHNESLQDLTN